MELVLTDHSESLQSFALQDELVGQASEAMLSEPRWFGLRRFASAVVAATTLLSGCAAASASSPESDQAHTGTSAESTSSAAATPFEFSMHPAPATTAPTPQTTVAAEQPAPVSPLQPVPAPETPAPFTLTLNTHLTPPMTTVVYPKHVPLGGSFELDEPDCPWQTPADRDKDVAAGTVPSGCDWGKTTAWADTEDASTSPYPQIPSLGETDAGGHVCIMMLNCGFTGIERVDDGDGNRNNDPVNVTTEDTITEVTLTGRITLQVCGTSTSKKYPDPGESPTLPVCTVKDPSGADIVVKPDLIIGTCLNDKKPDTGEYVSDTNFYIAGKAIASEPIPAQ